MSFLEGVNVLSVNDDNALQEQSISNLKSDNVNEDQHSNRENNGFLEGVNVLSVNDDNALQEQSTPAVQAQEQPQGSWTGRNIVKPVIKGLTSTADIPFAIGNLAVGGVNKATGMDIPYAKYPTEYIGDGVDYITGGYTAGEPGIVGKGIEYGTSMLGGGIAGKALKEGSKISPWLGSTKKSDIATAGAMGAITQGAENMGFDPLSSAGIGLATAMTPAGLKASYNKGVQKTLSKSAINKSKSFDLAAYDAAQAQGIDLPRSALDKSLATKIGQIAGEHSILSGYALKKQSEKTKLSFLNAVERNLNKTSIKDSLENKDIKNKIYAQRDALLTDKDVVAPITTLKALKNADSKTKKLTTIKNLEKTIKAAQLSSVLGSFSSNSISFPNINKSAIPIKSIINEKVKINKILQKSNNANTSINDYEAIEALTNIRDSLNKDIATYAKNNPKFSDLHYKAEDMHAGIKNRIYLDKQLGLTEIARPEINFNTESLQNNILTATKNPQFRNAIGGDQNIQNWKDIAKAAYSLPTTKVSNLAFNMKVMALLSVALTTASGGTIALKGAAVGFAADKKLSKYLTNKKVMNRMASYARNPSKKNKIIIENTIKNEMGMSVEQLNNRFSRILNNLDNSTKARLGISTQQGLKTHEKQDNEGT